MINIRDEHAKQLSNVLRCNLRNITSNDLAIGKSLRTTVGEMYNNIIETTDLNSITNPVVNQKAIVYNPNKTFITGVTPSISGKWVFTNSFVLDDYNLSSPTSGTLFVYNSAQEQIYDMNISAGNGYLSCNINDSKTYESVFSCTSNVDYNTQKMTVTVTTNKGPIDLSDDTYTFYGGNYGQTCTVDGVWQYIFWMADPEFGGYYQYSEYNNSDNVWFPELTHTTVTEDLWGSDMMMGTTYKVLYDGATSVEYPKDRIITAFENVLTSEGVSSMDGRNIHCYHNKQDDLLHCIYDVHSMWGTSSIAGVGYDTNTGTTYPVVVMDTEEYVSNDAGYKAVTPELHDYIINDDGTVTRSTDLSLQLIGTSSGTVTKNVYTISDEIIDCLFVEYRYEMYSASWYLKTSLYINNSDNNWSAANGTSWFPNPTYTPSGIKWLSLDLGNIYNGTITPNEYNTAIDTASEILGEEV